MNVRGAHFHCIGCWVCGSTGGVPSSPRVDHLTAAAQDLDRTRQSLDQQIRQRQELEQRKAALAQKLAETEQFLRGGGASSPAAATTASVRSFASSSPRAPTTLTTTPNPLARSLGGPPASASLSVVVPPPPSNTPPTPLRARDILLQARSVPKPF